MNQKTIIFASSLAVALAFSWFFIWPQMQNIDGLRTEIEEEREVLDSLQEAEEMVRSAIELKGQIERRDTRLINLAVPHNPERVEATILFNRIAENSGFTVGEISASAGSESASGGMLSSVNMRMNLAGSYSSTKTLLSSLENSLRIFDISALEIRAPQLSPEEQDAVNSQDQVEFSVEVRGNVFYSSR
ncbi:MAG: hypothetical protein WDZ39_00200 [Candidatus Spechtbacterales bacterium]